MKKWLEILYKFNKVKKLVKKHNALLKSPVFKKFNFFKDEDINNILKNNIKYIKTYKHAVAVYQQSSLVYNIYFKTSKKQDNNMQNIEVDESNKLYIYYKGEKLHFQNEEEFNKYFEILKESEMQKKLFSEDYLQQLFLEKVKEKANTILIEDGTDQFYFENKLVEKFCIENINKGDFLKRLNELEEVIQQFNREYEMESNKENNEAEETKKNPSTLLDE